MLTPVCVAISWYTVTYRLEGLIFLIFLTQLLLIGVFTVKDIFLFYVLFEALLIPIFLIIGVWGSRRTKNWGSLQIFYVHSSWFYRYVAILLHIFLVRLVPLI